MCRQIMHVFCAVALFIFGFSSIAQAVALGKIDVASHLGESFYAEIPLELSEDEVISSIFVELASPADYRILEVFRDQSVSSIRSDIKSDSRGERIELTSAGVVDAPFFNLVLKVRHGHATHFKKFTIFLDLPRAGRPVIRAKAQVMPVVKETAIKPVKTNESTASGGEVTSVSMPAVEGAPVVDETTAGASSSTSFKAYDDWARSKRYGPMVFGDTITTVAQRLRVDGRFTNQQVMVALFEKNKSKFDQGNINLIKAGTYLDVPTADEVKNVTPAAASSLLKEHNNKWKELTKQSKYARVKEAQKNRYGKRIRIGESASGVAAKPIIDVDASNVSLPASSDSITNAVVNDGADTSNTSGPDSSAANAATSKANAQAAQLAALKEAQSQNTITQLENEKTGLQQRLLDMEAQLAKLSNQKAAPVVSTPNSAAADARIKKLEIQLARQTEALEKARKQAAMQPQQSDTEQGISMLNWILIGAVALLSIIVSVLIFAGRGKREHPASDEPLQGAMDDDGFYEAEEIEVEEVEEDLNFEETMLGASADDFEDPQLDSIPDLTDADTSEMDAFNEDGEVADPNVDYLSEADVYMRYGMEDEAEQQVKMALNLREDHKDAHVKLMQIRHARGDQGAVEEAADAARAILGGEALASFEKAYDSLGGGEEVSLDDTAPPMEAETSEPNVSDSLDMADFDLPDFSENTEPEAVDDLESTMKVESLDFSDMGLSSDTDEAESPVADSISMDLDETPEEAPVPAASDDSGDLEFDLGGLDLPALDDGQVDVAEDIATTEATAESLLDMDAMELTGGGEVTLEPEVEAEKPQEIAGSESLADDFGLDLSDLEMPVDDESDGISMGSSIEDDDVDSTVVMDWSKETAVLGDEETGKDDGLSLDGLGDFDEPVEASLTSEMQALDVEANDIDLSFPSLDDAQGGTASVLPSQVEEGVTTLDDENDLGDISLNLDDLDIDLGEVDPNTDLDDFTSTIQSTLTDLGIAADEQLGAPSLESSPDDSLGSVDMTDEKIDLDASMELDDLLSDLEKFSDEDKV